MKILVVDDKASVAATLAELLSHLGHEPLVALSGDTGLEILRGVAGIDRVFTDYEMPGMDGLEFARRVKAFQPKMPIILMSGAFTERTKSEPLPEGILARLRKPWEIQEITLLLAA